MKHKVQAKQIKLPLFLVSVHCIMIVFQMVRETAKKEKKDQKKQSTSLDERSVAIAIFDSTVWSFFHKYTALKKKKCLSLTLRTESHICTHIHTKKKKGAG